MTSVAQRAFGSGELDPALQARTDLDRYVTGAKLIRNFLPTRNGGLMARGGLQYVGELPTFRYQFNGVWYNGVRQVDFVRDDDENFLIVITHNHSGSNASVRIYKDGVPVTLVLASTFTTWTVSASYVVGDLRRVGNVVYRCKLAHFAAFSLQGPTGLIGYVYWDQVGTYSADGVTLVLPISITTADTVKELQFVRERDGVQIFHRGSFPRKIYYDGTAGGFSVQLIDFSYTNNALQEPTISVSGTAGTGVGYVVTAAELNADFSISKESIASNEARTNIALASEASVMSILSGSPRTVSWSAIDGAEYYYIYRDHDGTGFRRISSVAAGTLSFQDTGVISGTQVPPLPVDPFATTGEVPNAATAYQQRLILGGTINNPDVVRGSRTGEPLVFRTSSPILDDDEVEWRAFGVRVQRVVHMANIGILLLLTTDGEWIVRGDTDGIIRPAEVNPEQIGYNGACRGVLPDIVGSSLVYADYNAATVREIRRNGQQFEMRELSVLAAHLLRDDRIESISVQRTPDPIVWVTTANGNLLSCTYSIEEGVLAWARHRVEDTENVQSQLFADVRVVPSSTVPRVDEVYVAMYYNGARYGLFKMGQRRPIEDASGLQERYAPVDFAPLSRIVATGSFGARVISGLTHLANKSVSLVNEANSVLTVVATLGDSTKPQRTVSAGGEVALTEDEFQLGGTWIVGLPIVSDLETLDIDTASGRTLKDGRINVSRLGLWIRESTQLWAGLEEPSAWNAITDLAKISVDQWTGAEDFYGNRTGYIEGNLLGRFNRSGRVFIRHVDPTPCNILGVAPQGFISQGG